MKRKPWLSPAVRAVLTDIAVFVLCSLFFGFLLLAPLAEAEEQLTPEETALLEAYQSGEIIRLHILAPSDTRQDQLLKLQVRDAVLAAFGERLAAAGANSAQEAWQTLQQETEAMERVARQCARAYGFSGAVSAQAGVLRLPEKRYRRVLLPEGPYRGLRIVLGEGKGHNWWCVLFPQLCLVLAGDEPWTASIAPDDRLEESAPPLADIAWDSEAIFAQWLAYPWVLPPGQVATNIMEPEQRQRHQYTAQEQSGSDPARGRP